MAPPPPSNKPSPLAIPELLEEVILHLPLRDILLCQRVDTHFRDVVQGSSNIKKVLFLEPATNKTEQYHWGITQRRSFRRVAAVEEEGWRFLKAGEEVHPLLNPFLMSLCATDARFWEYALFDARVPPTQNDGSHPESAHLFVVPQSSVITAAKICQPYALATSGGSYAQMHITHPPCEELDALARDGGDHRIFVWSDRVVEYSRVGVRFGTLLGVASRVLERQAYDSTPARPFGRMQMRLTGASHWRICPESVLDHVTGWEMLAVMRSDPRTMDDQISRIIEARKQWEHAAGETTDEVYGQEHEPQEALGWVKECGWQEFP